MNVPKEYEFIEKIRTRPGMWLGSNSVTALQHFLNGCRFALQEIGNDKADTLFPLDFYFMHEYTGFLFDLSDTAGWRNHILWKCGGDEEKALFKFFELFDEFKEIRAEKYWRAVLSHENIAYNNSMEHCFAMRVDEKQPIYDNPVCAYVIKLTIPAYLLAVETDTELRVERHFHPTFEHTVGNKHFPEGAEVYFGKIDNWTEVPDTDEIFSGKPVRL